MCLAIPGQLLSVEGNDPLTRQGRVSFAGLVKQANLAYVPDVKVGDYVLVHAGFAIAVIDQAEAVKTLDYLAEIGSEDVE
ncbi:MAG: HypC/HybG/HupF family hydrogenase formation chaperone [Rhodospirillales bacterium]|nr:HypC/HybG/HupF family hydrogenase formation chaperone [Rhodospirillales bacterium]